MRKLSIMGVLLAAIFGVMVAVAPSASALPRVGAQGLTVTAANPSAQQLGTQMAALNNPDVAIPSKLANIYQSTGPNRPVIDLWFRYIATVKQGDVSYTLGTPARNGNTISMPVRSTAKGMGTYNETFYWQRDGGRWKYDVIRWCKSSPSCPGRGIVR